VDGSVHKELEAEVRCAGVDIDQKLGQRQANWAAEMHKILIVGVSGMLGRAIYRLFAASPGFHVAGAARSPSALDSLPRNDTARIAVGVDISDFDRLVRLFADQRPDVVINCVGVIKQLAAAKDPLISIATNALFPHRLAQLCTTTNARMVQISTDCVFTGRRGNYRESDCPDAEDLYGRTKLLGEVDYPNAITLRTSIIGHETGKALSLVDWFLNAPGPQVRGYRKAIYSGLPTVELARVIRDYVIPRPELNGLWHVSSDPINKYDLLKLVAKTYRKKIEILPDDSVSIDRSLDGSRFRKATGYVAAPWNDLVQLMHDDR
jgi:dTDP-4-dehydrorhamnose reductase